MSDAQAISVTIIILIILLYIVQLMFHIIETLEGNTKTKKEFFFRFIPGWFLPRFFKLVKRRWKELK